MKERFGRKDLPNVIRRQLQELLNLEEYGEGVRVRGGGRGRIKGGRKV